MENKHLTQILTRLSQMEQRLGRIENHGHGQYEIGLQGIRAVAVTSAYQGLAVSGIAHVDLALGDVVCYLQGASGQGTSFDKVPASGNELSMPAGVVFAAASAGTTVWVIVAGYAIVQPIASIAPTRGYIIYTSGTTAGCVEQASAVLGVSDFRRVGYWADSGKRGEAGLALLQF